MSVHDHGVTRAFQCRREADLAVHSEIDHVPVFAQAPHQVATRAIVILDDRPGQSAPSSSLIKNLLRCEAGFWSPLLETTIATDPYDTALQ